MPVLTEADEMPVEEDALEDGLENATEKAPSPS